MTTSDLYRAAGVDIDAGNAAAQRYAVSAKRTHRPEVLGGIGGFSGGFRLDVKKYPEPVLVSGTDGVGTKLKIAFATGRHETIGIDCVAMCVNDILTSGAEPLFFLDYLAVGHLEVDVAATIVSGVAEGCTQSGCALIGGETAEMPDMYQEGEYDVAGMAVGVVNASEMVDGHAISSGDIVLGLASNGVHSNGYSLVRKLVKDAGLDWSDTLPGWRGTVAEELLRPTRIYVKSIRRVIEAKLPIKGMAHITGGGLVENLPRCLPDGLSIRLIRARWSVPGVMQWLQAQAALSFAEAARIWNMGIGYALVVSPEAVNAVTAELQAAGESVSVIGEVTQQANPEDQRVTWGDAK